MAWASFLFRTKEERGELRRSSDTTPWYRLDGSGPVESAGVNALAVPYVPIERTIPISPNRFQAPLLHARASAWI